MLTIESVIGQSIGFGVLTSLNYSSYGVKNNALQRKNFDYPLNYGGSVGIAIRYSPSNEQVSRKFLFRPIVQTEGKISTTFMLIKANIKSLNFEQESYEVTRFEYNLTVGFDYKRIYQFLIGPSFNTIIAAKKTLYIKDNVSRVFPESDREFKRFGIGINTSFGYKWKKFLFSVQYERQITDFRTTLFNSSVEFKMNTLRLVSVFFLFNKNNEKYRDSLFGL